MLWEMNPGSCSPPIPILEATTHSASYAFEPGRALNTPQLLPMQNMLPKLCKPLRMCVTVMTAPAILTGRVWQSLCAGVAMVNIVGVEPFSLFRRRQIIFNYRRARQLFLEQWMGLGKCGSSKWKSQANGLPGKN